MYGIKKEYQQFHKNYILYGFGVKLERRTNPLEILEKIMNELKETNYSFEDFLKKAEEKKIDLVVAEKFFEQKLLEGEIILKPNKMYQNIP